MLVIINTTGKYQITNNKHIFILEFINFLLFTIFYFLFIFIEIEFHFIQKYFIKRKKKEEHR